MVDTYRPLPATCAENEECVWRDCCITLWRAFLCAQNSPILGKGDPVQLQKQLIGGPTQRHRLHPRLRNDRNTDIIAGSYLRQTPASIVFGTDLLPRSALPPGINYQVHALRTKPNFDASGLTLCCVTHPAQRPNTRIQWLGDMEAHAETQDNR